MEPTLRDYFTIVRKRIWIVVAAVALCVAAAVAATLMADPVYEAEAEVFVGQRQISTSELTEGVQVTQLSAQLLETYAYLIKKRSITELAVERDSLTVAPQELSEDLVTEPVANTQVIKVRYASLDPGLSQRVVNAVADTFVGEIQRIENPSEGEAAVKVSVVEPALRPEEPVSPKPLINLVIALALGLMLGIGLAVALEYLDTTVKGREDVEHTLGLPVLATIPRVDTEGAEVYLERDSQAPAAEAFRKLRTAIQFLGVDSPVHVILVTSPFSQDGKTTTALNLAAAYAHAGLRTLLVEADLRRPSIYKVFPSDGQKGLTTCLVGRVTLEQATLPTPVRNLQHIPAGAIPPNPSELLSSGHMGDLIHELRASADAVIIDAPPLLPVADAAALASRVDGVMLVARSGTTSRDRLKEAADLTGKVGGRLLGVVVNFVKSDSGSYEYYYRYGYRGRPASTQEGWEQRPVPTPGG